VKEIEELTQFKKPIRYCQVDVGDANGTGELQGIICGARNFEEGSIVPVSLPGAVLPGGFKIAARETYDHISNGMICSAAELGLTSILVKTRSRGGAALIRSSTSMSPQTVDTLCPCAGWAVRLLRRSTLTSWILLERLQHRRTASLRLTSVRKPKLFVSVCVR